MPEQWEDVFDEGGNLVCRVDMDPDAHPSHVWVGFRSDGHPLIVHIDHPKDFDEMANNDVTGGVTIGFWVKVSYDDYGRCGFPPWPSPGPRVEWERLEPSEFNGVDVWLPTPSAPFYASSSPIGDSSGGG